METTSTQTGQRTRATDARGFSMIELMVVFVIIGLTLAIATPAFNTYRQHLGRKQARGQVVGDVRAARQLAVTQRTRVVVAFGNGKVSNTTSYTIHADKNGDSIVQSNELIKVKTLPKGTTLSKLKFTPGDSLLFEISGLLRSGTKGGYVIVKSGKDVDTVDVSVSGMAYAR